MDSVHRFTGQTDTPPRLDTWAPWWYHTDYEDAWLPGHADSMASRVAPGQQVHWIVRRWTLGAGLEAPRGSVHADPRGWVCQPHFVGKLPHLFVNEEHKGPVQADCARAGPGPLRNASSPSFPRLCKPHTRLLSVRPPTWHPAPARGLRSVPEAIGSTCASSQHPVID